MPEDKELEGNISIPLDADEESKKIAEEVEADAKAQEESKEDSKEVKEPEEEKKEEAGDKEEEKKDDSDEEEKTKRTPQTMPIYKYKIAEKRWEKDKDDLNQKINDLEIEVKKKSTPEKEKAINDFAERHAFEPEMVNELLGIVESGQPNLRKELDELRADIEFGKKEKERIHQYNEFEKDYEKTIVPLLEKDGIPSEKQKEVRKLLKTLAFTTEYANTPSLSVIYRGDESFDEFRDKGKKSAERSRGGVRGGKETEPETAEDIMDQSDKDFEEFSNRKGMEQRNIIITRKGESIV